jgi:hypothetical protein
MKSTPTAKLRHHLSGYGVNGPAQRLRGRHDITSGDGTGWRAMIEQYANGPTIDANGMGGRGKGPAQ